MDAGAPEVESLQDVVAYDAEFFALYHPVTALEMVRRLPGFQLDDGEDKRGFGAASGNVLINDRYPSAKQDTASTILERIPASQVERIDLIRGRVRGIDLRSQSSVISVILREDIPATVRWDLATRKTFDLSPLTVRGSVSLSDTWKSLEYNAGLVYRRFRSSESGVEDIYDPSGTLLEARLEDDLRRGDLSNVNLNMLTWIGETLITVNTRFGTFEFEESLNSVVAPEAPDPQSDDFFVDTGDEQEFEIGADAERNFGSNLLAKAIFIYTREEEDGTSTQNRVDSAGALEFIRFADSNIVQSEGISRLEFDWAGWEDHAINFDIEVARNVIDAELVQTLDTGSGPVIVPVPGANTRVEENRFEFLLGDTWYRGALEIGYSIGGESSTISQSGDATNKRSFTFLKPNLSVAYSPTQERQTRLRLGREVSQLDFSDFVSSTVFQDDDLALGNPDLSPESTWVAELSEERRLGELGVFKITLFYHWITDVEDLLPARIPPPIDALSEVPGNIGSGERWGALLETTIPLDRLGLTGARLDIEARLQDSSVTDPVTGEDRVLSGEGDVRKPLSLDNENRYAFAVDFRQDLEVARFAWGWNLRKRGNRFEFKVDELVEHEDGLEVNVFVETTRWWGLKIRFDALNLADFHQFRYRDIYTDERELSPLDRIEIRDRTDGVRVRLTLAGSF
ncbi:MAG: TonB-dependent receptor [Proteobacteria bacterium]|nr:TonB-dependent receptor [Pseudomonadota bacterium]